jgi:hypothetical protein
MTIEEFRTTLMDGKMLLFRLEGIKYLSRDVVGFRAAVLFCTAPNVEEERR